MSAPSAITQPEVENAAVTSSAFASSSSSSATSATATQVRKGGVGAGLATESWWDQYYIQQHNEYFDWYLPNEIVQEKITQLAKGLCEGEGEKEEREQEEQNGTDADTVAAESTPTSSSTLFHTTTIHPHTLSTLPILQIGCGNSEVTSLLWDAGVRTMKNIDFSSECIVRMKQVQKEKGWIAGEAGATATTAFTPIGSSSASSTFTFDVMDVRSLTYPSSFFHLIFGKGTLDCVVLESEDGITSGRAMLAEVHRVLRTGGIYCEFSIYPPQARAKYFIHTGTQQRVMQMAQGLTVEEEDPSITAERDELCELMECDNPPRHITAPEWQLQMIELDCSPLELPNQPHTYIYIGVKS